MKLYCTVEDVLTVATTFRKDVQMGSGGGTQYSPNTGLFTQDDIEVYIEEASYRVQSLYQPRYSIAVVDGYTDIPPTINYITKIYTAVLLFKRFYSTNTTQMTELITSFNSSLDSFKRIIANGELRDANSVLIPTIKDPSIMLGSGNTDFRTDSQLKALYKNGRQY